VGLTFELSRWLRQAALPVRPMMNQGGRTGKAACRRQSALERGVRPHTRPVEDAAYTELT